MIILVVSLVIAAAYTMRYAIKVKKNPELSHVAELEKTSETHIRSDQYP